MAQLVYHVCYNLARSPDLNPMEQIWDILSRCIRQRPQYPANVSMPWFRNCRSYVYQSRASGVCHVDVRSMYTYQEVSNTNQFGHCYFWTVIRYSSTLLHF